MPRVPSNGSLPSLSDDLIASRKRKDREDAHESVQSKRSKAMDPDLNALASSVLKERFALNEFRLKQEQAILRLLEGESSVVIFPTGGGKSLCYQVPAVAFRELDRLQGRTQGHGVSLVISPLIALMKDQVDALLRRKIKAAALDSTIPRDKFLTIQEDLRTGQLDLLYCAPERLNSEGFIASLKAIPGGIRLLAVDEAHCISEWGHSFRPDYLKIARFAKEANVERVVCLTATATPKVAQDICDAFNIPKEGLFTTTMYRPNLRLLAKASAKNNDNVADLVEFLHKHPGPSIVYVTIQKGAETLADSIHNRGFKARAYHAGMDAKARTKIQDEFLESEDMVVVATIAFGMGIDKPDIRNIVHFDIPSSIESYSQQIGRAGRDGKPSVCLFNLSTKDFHLRQIFTYGDRPSLRSLRLLLEDICSLERTNMTTGDTFEVSHYKQSRDCDIRPTTLAIIYTQLELRFKLFRASGCIYTEYKYETIDSRRLLTDDSPAAKAILKGSKKAAKWTRLDIQAACASSSLPRSDLVRKIDQWNEIGAIKLERSGVQNLYRLERRLPSTKEELGDIIQQLDQEMEVKENQDLARTKAVTALITDKKCFSRALAEYFGEATASMSEECGHCTWCETHERTVLPDESPQPPDSAKVQQVLAQCAVRDDPRFLAKVAFGIKSPRVTSMGMHKKPIFESMNVCNFLELVRIFTEECKKSEEV